MAEDSEGAIVEARRGVSGGVYQCSGKGFERDGAWE